MPFYERGPVRIHYEEVGFGFPLLLIPGGGLNSAFSSWQTASPFNPMERYKDDFRCICADLRNANPGQSSGPLEIDRPWDAYPSEALDTSYFRPGPLERLGRAPRHHQTVHLVTHDCRGTGTGPGGKRCAPD